jgi:hypothetical protein
MKVLRYAENLHLFHVFNKRHNMATVQYIAAICYCCFIAAFYWLLLLLICISENFDL